MTVSEATALVAQGIARMSNTQLTEAHQALQGALNASATVWNGHNVLDQLKQVKAALQA